MIEKAKGPRTWWQEAYFFLKKTILSPVGQDQNKRAELFALWLLLKIASDKTINSFHILGYSKLIIDWAKGLNKLENLSLIPIMDRIREVLNKFEYIFFHLFAEN